MKNTLDDAVKEVLTEKLQYEEDHALMDVRLIICGLAVAVAMFALAWDYFYPFPASRYGNMKSSKSWMTTKSNLLCMWNSSQQYFFYISDKY